MRTIMILVLLHLTTAAGAPAQFLTIGGGALISTRSPEPVAELHAETPPVQQARAYITLSWTDESYQPTAITAVERPVVGVGRATAGLGAGLLWLERNDYRPYPIIVSSTVLQLPIPRTSVVAIASTQPFQDFEWSLVIKLGFTAWFVR